MFERFTPEARRIVTGGVEFARHLHHDFLGTEHLLMALADTGPNVATRALIACGFDPARAREDLERIVGPFDDDLGEADAAALRSIGVDLDEVRKRTEASFGPGALERRRRWHGRRRMRVCGLPFMPKAKQAMELAFREAIRLDQRSIGPEHVLLGLLRPDASRPSSSMPRASTPAGCALRSSAVSAPSVDAEREPAALAGVGPVALGSGHGIPHEAPRRR